MMKKLILLGVALISLTAHSQIIETNVSGFATATAFSDKNWFSNKQNVAVNLDIFYDDWAIRGQVASAYENVVRRLVVEKSFTLVPKQELIVQIGRFPRLASFFNSINDAPGTSGLAMLPLGEYSHRMVENSTYNSLDGIKGVYTIRTDKGLVTINVDYGILPLENQCAVQNEATSSSCRSGYDFVPTQGSHDIGLRYETGNWSFLGQYSNIKLKTDLLNTNDPVSKYISTQYNRVSFDLSMLGVKYTEKKWWVQSEVSFSDYFLATPGSDLRSVEKLRSIYLLSGINWNDRFSSYAIYSYSEDNGIMSNIDRAIGSTYTLDNTTISLEYHKGFGYGWQNYFSKVPGWNSWIVSATHRF